MQGTQIILLIYRLVDHAHKTILNILRLQPFYIWPKLWHYHFTWDNEYVRNWNNGFGGNKVFVWFSKYNIGSDNETSFQVFSWIHEILHIEADIYYAQHSICMHNNEAQLYPANNIVLYFSTTEIS